MKASVNIMPEVPVADVVDLAKRAEDLGFHRCWVYDEGLTTRDVYITLTAIAEATERVLVGPGITNPFTRHPGATAVAIATLDEVAFGRAFLGIGAGGSLTLDPLGIEHRYSLTAVGEMIAACRGLFSGEAVDMNGRYFSLDGARLDYARPETEIWLAGRGPKMLALGGAAADGVMLEFIHRELLDSEFARVRDAAAENGNRPILCYSTMIITNDDTMALTKAHMTYRLVDSPPAIRARMGISDDEVAVIRKSLPEGLFSAARHIRDEWVTPFVIAGSVDECARQIRALDEAGIEEFLLPVLQAEGAVELMETVAEVMAKV